MDAKDAQRRLRDVAGTLAEVGHKERTIAGTLGYLMGAAYGLLQCVDLGFFHTSGDPYYVNELVEVGRALRDGKPVPGERAADATSASSASGVWLGGFYFNSALHRIAAAADRMDALQYRREERLDSSVPDSVQHVYAEVNRLKHDKPGLHGGRNVEVSEAVSALEYLVERAIKKGVR